MIVLKELSAFAFQHDPAVFQHVSPIGYVQSLPDILLDEKDGNAVVAKPPV